MFNLGLGMLAVVAADDALTAVDVARAAGHDAWVVGEIVDGPRPRADGAGRLMQFRISRSRVSARRRAVGAVLAMLALPALASCGVVSSAKPLATKLCHGARSRAGRQARERAARPSCRGSPRAARRPACSGPTTTPVTCRASSPSIGPAPLRATVAVNVPAAVDWEDIAIDGKTIYIGDIGDNAAVRPSIVVYRVTEPALTAKSVNATTFTLRYPDGPHDAEALMVDPLEAAARDRDQGADRQRRRCTSPRSTTPARSPR